MKGRPPKNPIPIKWVGYDIRNIPRVWGTGDTYEIAESRCLEMAKEYVKKRPDTGPLSSWRFQKIET